MSKLYVGGLAYSITNDELFCLFEDHGGVVSANVVTDRDTGRSKGFGFVEMASNSAAANAIHQLNGKDVGGRHILVNEARQRAPRTTSNSRW